MTKQTAAFESLLQKLPVSGRVAVAVSGGGDSMALALLMHDVCGDEMIALTVDHGLRAESADEAKRVGEILRARGIAHHVLTWRGEKPATHIQERARDARYALLLDYCRAQGFDTLAVAHNLEDQIETFWMRLAHGSGLDGLAGMAARRTVGGVTIIRPLLGMTRAQLREVCTQRGVQWIDDPSNTNEKFLRPRLRGFEDVLAAEGLTPQRLALTLQKLEDARDALQQAAAETFARCVQLHDEGYATLNTGLWQAAPREIQRRVLVMALSRVAPQAYAPDVEELRAALQGDFAGQTLAGCEIFASRGAICIAREAAAVEQPIPAQNGAVWDQRFAISGVDNAALRIGALGETSVESDLPFKIRRTLPALWQDNRVLAVPHLDYFTNDCPEELKSLRLTRRA